jgi:hypothetical protein
VTAVPAPLNPLAGTVGSLEEEPDLRASTPCAQIVHVPHPALIHRRPPPAGEPSLRYTIPIKLLDFKRHLGACFLQPGRLSVDTRTGPAQRILHTGSTALRGPVRRLDAQRSLGLRSLRVPVGAWNSRDSLHRLAFGVGLPEFGYGSRGRNWSWGAGIDIAPVPHLGNCGTAVGRLGQSGQRPGRASPR